MEILTIIPAAWKPNNTIFPSYSNLPDCMIPINSKPVIWYILEDLLSRWIKNVLLLLNSNDIYTEKYVCVRYSGKFELLRIQYVNTSNLVETVYEWCKNLDVSKYFWIFVYLWDTIYKWNLSLNNDFLTVTSDFWESLKWCFVEKNENRYSFKNKPLDYKWWWKAITWLYFFKNINKFLNVLNDIKSWEISVILEKYVDWENIDLVESKWWYDCWHIDNFYKAKIDFLKVREFNWIKYNSEYWTITKSSESKKDKIRWEINRYKNIPHELKIFSPRLINYDFGDDNNAPFYEIEYYGYQSLWDMFVFSYLSKESWEAIVDNLFKKLSIFKKYKWDQPYSFFYDMYYDKTIKRVDELKKSEKWWNLLSNNEIIINDKEYKNVDYFLWRLENFVKNLYYKDDITFIHGDFCLSNILYDINNWIIKTIDPRWYFWELWVFWDHKYDVAKLRHSLVWFYDFIVSDLFKIEFNGDNKFNFVIYNEDIHSYIAEYFDSKLVEYGYNVEQIKFIEALLFLSMIPLHKDNESRQYAMFCIAIQKFNEII